MNKKDIKEEIRSIQAQIDELEKIEDTRYYLWKRTKPTDGDVYWYIEYYGFEVEESIWYGTSVDEKKYAMCNVFRTKEEALISIRKRMTLTELRKYACDLNDSGEKWGITYDGKTRTIVVTPLNSVNHSVLAFSSKDIAEKAINLVGRKRIAKYLFGESDKEKIKELKEKLLSLKKELTELVTKEVRDAGYWVPNDGDTYWYISIYGNIEHNVWDIMKEDSRRLAVGNVFKTKEDIEFELERLKILSLIKPFTCKFRQTNDPLYVIIPTNDDDVEVSSYDYIYLTDTTVYFETEEQAHKAIELIGKDKLNKYLFGKNVK